MNAPYDKVAICPGTYDPVTEGHLDIIARAAVLFDRVVVGVVAASPRKDTLFSAEERVAFLRESLADTDSDIEVEIFDTLLVDFARKWRARALVKGLRAISDFEYEFQMAQLNRKLAPDLETIYLMASPEFSFLSSSGVKEIAKYKGNVDDLVPPAVARRFAELFR
ncbi:MAG: pantetheine-phosphate adenylyltransferase [Thermoleophilia bacterium]|nr:pantetheine-phosphate adenylyltransferase [Thermoleophilia bacterium]